MLERMKGRSVPFVAATLCLAVIAAGVGAVAAMSARQFVDPSETVAGTDVAADYGTGMMIPAPKDLSELVGVSHLVVLARVSGPLNVSRLGPYEPEFLARSETPTDKISPRIEFTDFELIPTRVFKGVPSLGTITLRMPGSASDPVSRALSAGRSYLFFLTRNPDGTYGHYHGQWGRLDISGPAVRFSDASGAQVPFALNQTPAQFIAQLEAIR